MTEKDRIVPNPGRRILVLGSLAALGSTACVPDALGKFLSGLTGQQAESQTELPFVQTPQKSPEEPLPSMRFQSSIEQEVVALALLDKHDN